MTKKYFGLTLILIVVMLMGNIGLAFGQDEPIELRIAWWGSQNRHDRTIAVIEMFEELHPNIDIIYEPSGWDDHWTKMTTQAAGGNLPDIMQQDYARLEEWVSRDLIMPLDGYLEDGTIDVTNVSDAALAGGRIDGQLYGFNLGTNSMNFALDVADFEAAGLDLPSPDWTWAEFEEVCTALYDALDKWCIAGRLSNNELWKALMLGEGLTAYNADGTALGYEDDQPLIDYFNMIMRLQDAGMHPDIAVEVENAGQSIEADFFVTRQASMSMFWSNQIVAVWTAGGGDERNIKLWEVPRPVGGVSENYIKPSMFFSITSQAQHPDEAAMFIDFFTNSVEANEVLAAERGVPVSSAVREAMLPNLTTAQAEMFDFLSRVEADNSPIPPPDPPGHGDIVNNVYDPLFVDQVRYHQMSVEDGVALLRTEASAILAQNE